MGHLDPSLKFCLFQGKVYLSEVTFSFCEKSSWVVSRMKVNHYTFPLGANSIFNLPGISSLQFPALSATCSMRLGIEGHAPVLRTSLLCHSPLREVLLLHAHRRASLESTLCYNTLSHNYFSSENAGRETSTSTI